MTQPPPPLALALVTGATDGIGKQTALELARAGFAVILHGRSLARLDAARDAIAHDAPSATLHTLCADLASFSDIRRAADDLRAQHDRLHVLINNAGVFSQARALSADGFELTLAVNHLAPFLMTLLLLPMLRAASQPAAPARVITVSSIAHQRGRIRLDDLHLERTPYDGYQAYAASKLANVLFSNALARRLDPAQVTSNSLHPGVITTKLLRAGFNMSGASLAEGAATSVHLATSPDVAATSGAYFAASRAVAPAPSALDPSLQDQLWDASARLTQAPTL
jgi:NAD(P)-dependent dehydrogenase (short-subunit alcohol dehydrogenase family)